MKNLQSGRPGRVTRQREPTAAEACDSEAAAPATSGNVANCVPVRRRDWSAIRAAYEAHEGTLKALAERLGVPLSTLAARANNQRWIRIGAARRARKVQPTGLAVDRERLLRRLYATLERKVQHVEASLDNNPDKSVADHERETRTIGTLIRNVEKVHDLDPSVGGGSASGAQSTNGFAAAGTDEDRLRLELAARIHRLCERLAR